MQRPALSESTHLGREAGKGEANHHEIGAHCNSHLDRLPLEIRNEIYKLAYDDDNDSQPYYLNTLPVPSLAYASNQILSEVLESFLFNKNFITTGSIESDHAVPESCLQFADAEFACVRDVTFRLLRRFSVRPGLPDYRVRIHNGNLVLCHTVCGFCASDNRNGDSLSPHQNMSRIMDQYFMTLAKYRPYHDAALAQLEKAIELPDCRALTLTQVSKIARVIQARWDATPGSKTPPRARIVPSVPED